MALFLVFRAICKALLLMFSGANVVHERQKEIRKNLTFKFLRILLCDPLGVRTQDPILKRDVLYRLS